MGDLGLTRRPPDGWLEAVAVSTGHRVTESPHSDRTRGEVDTSYWLTVTWEVRVPGREPYLCADERRCPTWTTPASLGGSGRRWYAVRLRRTYGLLEGVEVPCRVDPADPSRLWIDWDGAYRVHEVAWDDRSAMDRAVAERRGGFDGVMGRLANPFAPRVRPEDQHRVDAEVARRDEEARQEQAAATLAAAESTWGGVDTDERARLDAMTADLLRIQETGRPARGRLLAIVPTDRTMVGVTVKRIDVEVHDTTPPRVVGLELPLQPAVERGLRIGADVEVWVDREDPTRICIR